MEIKRRKEARDRAIELDRQERKQYLNAWRVNTNVYSAKMTNSSVRYLVLCVLERKVGSFLAGKNWGPNFPPKQDGSHFGGKS